jgi:dTDP-4-dehydrorhamnose reductase
MTADLKNKDLYLVIGGDSFIGRRLRIHIIGEHKPVLWTSKRKESSSNMYLNLDQEKIVWEPPYGVKAAFFCAAKTSILECEKNPEETRKVNVKNTLKIIKMLCERSIPVVYLSSSLVFDGETCYPDESAKTSPVTEYGYQKSLVEKELINMGPAHNVVRLSKVISNDYPLFQNWVSRLKQQKEIEAFCDYYFSPLSVGFVSRILFDIARLQKGGVWHISGNRAVSYYEAALALAETIGVPSKLVVKRHAEKLLDKVFLSPSTVLKCSRLESWFGIFAPDVMKTIKNTLKP